MNIIKRTIGAVALTMVAAVGYGDGVVVVDGAEREVDGTGASVQNALDLSDVWDKPNVDAEPILWSSLGWDPVAEAERGKTVTLQLVLRSNGEEQELESGLKGHCQTYIWTPRSVMRQIYDIRHIVVGGSPLETLNASFSFEHYEHVKPSEGEVRAAIAAEDGSGYGVVNDEENWWNLAGGPREGITAPQKVSSLTFAVDGHGTFLFDYTLAGGAWVVRVDGVEVRTLDAGADWKGVELPMDGRHVRHVIEFVTELSGDDSATLKNVRWVDPDERFGGGQGGDGRVDLREGVLVVRRANELMPFAWSSTNFTGIALVKDTGFVTIDPQSVASVRVVQVTGVGDDVSQWTTEVTGTEKTLVAEQQGEGAANWKHVKPGVWKAELVITTGDGETYRETRILDLRKYVGQGLLLYVK